MTDELIWGGLGNLRFLQVNNVFVRIDERMWGPCCSFLHAASAKMISERLRSSRNEENPPSADDPSDDSLRFAAATCRMLLVEDEGGGGGGGGSLARSLAMDAARSLASSSSFPDVDPCRGCRPSGAVVGDDVDAAGAAWCRCCRVALLVVGGRPRTTRKGSRKRRRPSSGNESVSLPPDNHSGRRVEFPMPCVAARRDGIDDDDVGGMDGGWAAVALGRISVKYVKTSSDVVKYLAYATSLPDHARPSRGLFLLGAGDCLPRQNASMELVHLRKFVDLSFSFLGRLPRRRFLPPRTHHKSFFP